MLRVLFLYIFMYVESLAVFFLYLQWASEVDTHAWTENMLSNLDLKAGSLYWLTKFSAYK